MVTECSFFKTPFGWFALAGHQRTVERVLLGLPSKQAAEEAVKRTFKHLQVVETDWWPELRERLEAYTQGEPVQFVDVALPLERLSAFSQTVLKCVSRIPFGQVLTYSQVAAAVGRPKAARAVGNVLASNRWPILIPCHRVVAASGRLGGFTAPGGVALKTRLLHLEGVVLPSKPLRP